MGVIQLYAPKRDAEFMASLMAINVMQFLFCQEYNFRFGCILGQSELCLTELWSLSIFDTIEAIKRGDHTTDPQRDLFFSVGYSCNICRIELNWYEYVYRCNCDSDMTHDFCISCIHSMFIQYEEMKPFLAHLLMDVLDNNSIEMIVAFCVGKVTKFFVCNKDKNEDDQHGDGLIDDSKCVGSKRNIRSDTCPNKRRRLQ